MSSQSLILQVTTHTGEGGARPGDDVDAIDDVCPRVVASPPSVEALSSLLAWASADGLATFIRGGGTKLEWGGVSRSIDLLVSTSRLTRVIEHRHGDLTATIEAGATLAKVNAVLDTHHQWLPLDPPWPGRATIGGIIATNDSGPSRHRHGAPRDLIIGVTMVRPDGRLAKAGGIVVKNVAGYDLSRLMTGAFGVLGVVVDATFKLSPVSSASRTVMIEVGSMEEAAPIVQDLLSSGLTPSAIELEWPPARLLVKFESVESAVEQQANEVNCLASGRVPSCPVTICDGVEESALWRAYAGRWDDTGTLVKVSTLSDTIFPTLIWLRDTCRSQSIQMSAQGRAGLGVVDVRMDGVVDSQVRLITELRERLQTHYGSAVIRRGSPELRQAVDPWGSIGDGMKIMQAIKQRFDPGEGLNIGRGPGGL